MEVRLDGAIGISHDASEVVTYVSVSDEASRTDHHPLAICTEGELFCGTGELRPKVARKARAAGMQVYERFRVLVDALRPAYGAITVEIPLCCPTDLRRDPRSLAFRDFFVARTFFGGSIMTKLEALFTGAFVEPVGDGVYVSCSKEFNPEARNVDGDIVQWRSVEMGKLVAAAAEGARARREPQ
jgi:hypothetical protein